MKIWSKLKIWQKVLIIIFTLALLIETILIAYKLCNKYLLTNQESSTNEHPVKEKIDLENYDYYSRNNATEYEKLLFEDLKKILSQEEVNEEEYAKTIAQLFLSDLLTLNNKNSSSDITSSQYVYESYQKTYENMVRDTIYANIELNIDDKREQALPIVKNITIDSIEQKAFSLNKKVIDPKAYYIKATIEYVEDLKYPTNYNLVIIKNNDLLQIAKAN